MVHIRSLNRGIDILHAIVPLPPSLLQLCPVLPPKQNLATIDRCLLIRAWTRKVLNSLTQRSQQHIRTRCTPSEDGGNMS